MSEREELESWVAAQYESVYARRRRMAVTRWIDSAVLLLLVASIVAMWSL